MGERELWHMFHLVVVARQFLAAGCWVVVGGWFHYYFLGRSLSIGEWFDNYYSFHPYIILTICGSSAGSDCPYAAAALRVGVCGGSQLIRYYEWVTGCLGMYRFVCHPVRLSVSHSVSPLWNYFKWYYDITLSFRLFLGGWCVNADGRRYTIVPRCRLLHSLVYYEIRYRGKTLFSVLLFPFLLFTQPFVPANQQLVSYCS